MRRLTIAIVTLCALLLYFAPGSRALMSGVAYTDFANIFTSNQRINAGLGVNVAPGSTGTISTSGALFERSRSTAMGEWTDVAFASGNFTGNGSMTVTVQSGDQITFAYNLVGKSLHVALILDTITVGGTPNSLIQIAIPGGFTAARKHQAVCYLADNGTFVAAFVRVNASGTLIEVGKADGSNMTASTNNTYIRADFTFSIS